MKLIGIFDCGTTNSRFSIVNSEGTTMGSATSKIGVKDTALSGSNEALKSGLRSLFARTITSSGIAVSDVAMVISSGMITSELGIVELPHLLAPAGINEIAGGLTKVEDEKSLDINANLYLVRGIKNKTDPAAYAPLSEVRNLDFMRGEETQVMGLLALYGGGIPTTVVNLSSHTKYISVDADDRIRGSITTLSGQVYESLLKETFIGKSIAPGNGNEIPENDGSMKERLAEATFLAARLVDEAGLLRCFLIPRFMDTLMSTDWRIRKRFFEACIAADDLKAQSLFPLYGFERGHRVFLVGLKERCEIFAMLFKETEQGKTADITILGDPEAVRNLAIKGALAIGAHAGLI